MLILGIATLYAVIPLLIDIGVAIVTTKWPMVHHDGWWAALHESAHGCMHVAWADCDCLPGRWDAGRFDRQLSYSRTLMPSAFILR